MITYSYECTSCAGEGSRDEIPCAACEGYGHFLSEEGGRLLEFLASRGFAMPVSPAAEWELRGMVETV